MEFQTKDDYINVFQSYKINTFVTFDPVNSYSAERIGEK